ncbi:MAG: hypothetical protein ACXVAN_00990 [Polyangia bacterium]
MFSEAFECGEVGDPMNTELGERTGSTRIDRDIVEDRDAGRDRLRADRFEVEGMKGDHGAQCLHDVSHRTR